MAKFRTRSHAIEAERWFPPGDPRHDPAMLVQRKGNAASPPDHRRTGDLYQFSTIPGMGDDLFMLRTVQGDVRVLPGDWIITGPAGEKSARRPDAFAATYEPA